jgi:LysM repeat protein
MFVRTLFLLLTLAGVIALVDPRPSSGASADVRYVVRAGDTLWALAAERYGGDPRKGVWQIRERNGLRGAGLTPGMVLYLPAGAGDA